MHDFQSNLKFTYGEWHLVHNEVKPWLVDSLLLTKQEIKKKLLEDKYSKKKVAKELFHEHLEKQNI